MGLRFHRTDNKVGTDLMQLTAEPAVVSETDRGDVRGDPLKLRVLVVFV